MPIRCRRYSRICSCGCPPTCRHNCCWRASMRGSIGWIWPRPSCRNSKQTGAHQRATLAVRKGDLAAGRALLELAGPRTPDDYIHYFVLAGVCDKLGDLPGALQALESAHALQAEEMRAVVPDRFAPDAPIIPTAVGRVTVQDYRAWPKTSAPD